MEFIDYEKLDELFEFEEQRSLRAQDIGTIRDLTAKMRAVVLESALVPKNEHSAMRKDIAARLQQLPQDANWELISNFIEIQKVADDEFTYKAKFPTDIAAHPGLDMVHRTALIAMLVWRFAEIDKVDMNILFANHTLLTSFIGSAAFYQNRRIFFPRSELAKAASLEEMQKSLKKEGDKKLGNLEAAKAKVDSYLVEVQSNLTAAEDRFSKLEERAKAFVHYKNLDDYFAGKRFWHTLQHYIWLAVFLVEIAATGFLVYTNFNEIEGHLPKWTKLNWEIGRAVMFALLAGTVIWVMRITVRFSTINLRLAEDAGNRTVLIRTLAALEHDRTGGLTAEERAIAYNAIFRPLISPT